MNFIAITYTIYDVLNTGNVSLFNKEKKEVILALKKPKANMDPLILTFNPNKHK